MNYINFLKSWSDLSSEIDSPQSIKRASSGDDSSIGYTYRLLVLSHRRSPKRRFVLTPPDDAALHSLAESIRLHILSLFGNVQPIFKALDASDSVYLHDLVGYFTQHRVACTLSQLHCLLQPFMSAPASITLSEFQKCDCWGRSSLGLLPR